MGSWTAVLVAVAASTANNVGKALQKEATRTLPRFSLNKVVFMQYLGSQAYLVGLATDVAGGIAMLAAFALAPVSLVQPVSGLGLVALSIFSHFYLQERLSAGEWAAAAVALVGAVGVGATQEERGEATLPTLWRVVPSMLFLAAGSVGLPLLGGSRGGLRAPVGASPAALKRTPSAPPPPGSRRAASMYGLQAGAFFGLSAAACRLGFLALWNPKPHTLLTPVLAQAGAFFGLSAAACRLGFLAARGRTWVAAPLGVLAGVGLTSTGLMLQTVGLKDGNTVVVCTCAAVASIAMGVLVGVLALNEGFPSTPGLAALRVLSLLLLALGVATLASGHGGAKQVLYHALKSLPQPVLQRMPQRAALAVRQWSQQLRPGHDLPT